MLTRGRKSSPSIQNKMRFYHTSNIKLTLRTFSPAFEGFSRNILRFSLPAKSRVPSNNKSCLGFGDFISSTILERVKNGSLSVWGRVGEDDPPHLVMPLTIEPSKPRLCHDERFLNLWIRDLPLKLDYISDLPRYVEKYHFQTTMDDKSGYDHVEISEESRKYFGLQWQGWYFVYNTIPFGWKGSAYVYHSIGMAATSYIRSLGVPCSQYVDDRYVGQLSPPPESRASAEDCSGDGSPQEEIEHWRFLDSWEGCLLWLNEEHVVVKISSDASNFGWGGFIVSPGLPPFEVRDYWTSDTRSHPIVVKEALAFVNTLQAGKSLVTNERVDAHSDSLAFLQSWEEQGGRNAQLNDALKKLHETAFALNAVISLKYVPSSANPADPPSRVLSDLDYTLSRKAWREQEQKFGPHTIDLMSLDSNSQIDSKGKTLRHFTPFWGFFFSLHVMQVLKLAHFHGTFLPSELRVESRHFPLFLSQSRRPRIWRPAVPCLQCAYLNDDSFNFCQRCGFRRDLVVVDNAQDLIKIDFKDIEDCISELKEIRSNKPYEKQKSSTHRELVRFLAS
ncbi:hypothetical protein ACROYT_G037537 [Oculina patagonica]